MDTNLSYKNNTNGKNSLIDIFTKKYIIFWLLAAAVFFTSYITLVIWSDYINHEPKIELLIQEAPSLKDKEYIYIDVSKYLGKNGKLILLDENGRTIYSNDNSLISDYLTSELLCIPHYYKDMDILGSGIKNLRFNYINNLGYERTLILFLGNLDKNEFIEIYILNNFGYICLLLYSIMGLFFFRKTAKNIKNSIDPINEAITALLDGSRNYLNNYTAPNEFMDISRNFDNLAEKLVKTEWERSRLDKGRQKLLSDISHDIKTPMTVIQGYSIALKDGMLPKEQQQMYLEVIYNKSQHITELLHTFHEYSKLEHPDFPVNFERKDLSSTIQIYLAEKYYEIELAGFFLEADTDCGNIICELDNILFCRAIDNIINNSIKYNSKGTKIIINISKEFDSIKITIGDNGIGISKELAVKIFEPFTTGDESRGTFHGSGLGPAITEKIILAHNGKIELKTPPDEGYSVQFEIILPIH